MIKRRLTQIDPMGLNQSNDTYFPFVLHEVKWQCRG